MTSNDQYLPTTEFMGVIRECIDTSIRALPHYKREAEMKLAYEETGQMHESYARTSHLRAEAQRRATQMNIDLMKKASLLTECPVVAKRAFRTIINLTRALEPGYYGG